MRKVVLAAICCLITAPIWAEECEDAVDLADSLDFHKMHVECDDDPVVLYDSKSKGSLFSRESKAVDTYADAPATEKAGKPVAQKPVVEQNLAISQSLAPTQRPASTVSQVQDNAGVVFNIREPFTLTGGPQSALNGLFAQMSRYCPQGWEKLKEWAEPNQGGYFLHYQFQCAE